MKNQRKMLAVVHSAGMVALYNRETLAGITHASSDNDFRTMKSAHKNATKTYPSVKDLLKSPNPEEMPYAIWIRNESVWNEMDTESLKALETFYTDHYVPVGISGNGEKIKNHLQKVVGYSVVVHSDSDTDPNNIVFFSKYSASGRHKDLYLTYSGNEADEKSTTNNKKSETPYHFPFNSDSENALGKLSWDEMSVIQQGDFPNPNTSSISSNGDPDLGRGPWLTYGSSVQYSFSNSDVSARIWIDPYKLNDNSKQYDYYLFMLNYSHGVNNYKQTCDTVGYYGQYMNLNIECKTFRSKIFSYGPNTTVNQASTGFTIGGGLKGGVSDGKPEAGLNFDASFSVSFTTSEVNITAIPRFFDDGKDTLKWEFTLPKVGWLQPAIPANPGASAKGYISYPCFIMQVPSNMAPEFTVTPDIKWVLDYTRGIEYKNHVWNASKNFKFAKLPEQ